jgi:tryptophan synthase alpha chain
MVKSITEKIKETQKENRLAFIPFVIAGDPDFEYSKQILLSLQSSGADIIELGIPYSDPLADGPVIQLAAKRALKSGSSLRKSIELMKTMKDELFVPVLIFTYYNPVLAYGLKSFIEDVKDAGFKGLLVPDLPVEEAEELITLANENELELVMLVTPTSGEERIKKITEASQGFVYLVSVTGVTGVRSNFSEHIQASLTKIKAVTDKPICVGFGISQPEHIDQLKELGASGAIVGSAIIRVIEANASTPEVLIQNLKAFVQLLRSRC